MKYVFLFLVLTLLPITVHAEDLCAQYCQSAHPESVAYQISDQGTCICLYTPDQAQTTPVEIEGQVYGAGAQRDVGVVELELQASENEKRAQEAKEQEAAKQRAFDTQSE